MERKKPHAKGMKTTAISFAGSASRESAGTVFTPRF